MDFNETVALNLISEMKKPGTEFLYDMGNKNYKNNHLKQGVWLTIATSIGMGRSECQALWKSLRRRYKTAKSKSVGRSGSQRLELKGFSKVLVNEMDYFQKFWEDNEPTVSNYVEANRNRFIDLFDEMAQDPEVNDSLTECLESPTDTSQSNISICSPPSTSKETQKRKRLRLADAEMEFEKSLRTLNNLTSSVIQSSADKIDPFFVSLHDEFLKVPENQKSALKLKLMTLVVEHHNG